MIIRWGYKTLATQKAATLAGIAGIAFSFLLALFFAAVWKGEIEQIVAYPKKLDPDLWVMQNGVANMHMASSFIWDWKADAIKRMPEVEQVTGFLYINTVIQLKDSALFGFVVGLPEKDSRAGPWKISHGRNLQADDEIIIPAPMRSIFHVPLGGLVRIVDRDYKVVGFSEGTYSSANPIFFVMQNQLEDSLSTSGMLSYLLIDAQPNVDIVALQQKITEKIEKVSVVTQSEFVSNDSNMAKQMGAETILIMTIICSVLAALIVGYVSYTLTLKKKKEIAIIKAIGGKEEQLVFVLLMQSIMLVFMAYFLALMSLLLISAVMPWLAPQISMSISLSLMFVPAALILVIAIIGSLYPAIKLVRLDPASAYSNG